MSGLSAIGSVATCWREAKSGELRAAPEAGSSTSTEMTGREDAGGNSSTGETVRDRVSEADKVGEEGGVAGMSCVGEARMIEKFVRGEVCRNVRKQELDGRRTGSLWSYIRCDRPLRKANFVTHQHSSYHYPRNGLPGPSGEPRTDTTEFPSFF